MANASDVICTWALSSGLMRSRFASIRWFKSSWVTVTCSVPGDGVGTDTTGGAAGSSGDSEAAGLSRSVIVRATKGRTTVEKVANPARRRTTVTTITARQPTTRRPTPGPRSHSRYCVRACTAGAGLMRWLRAYARRVNGCPHSAHRRVPSGWSAPQRGQYMVDILPCCIAVPGPLTHGAGRRVVALDCTRPVQATPGGTFPTRRPAAADSAPHDMKRG